MRFPLALSASASLLALVHADAQSVLSDASSLAGDAASSASSKVESATSSLPQLPTFTPTKLKADFIEQFTDDWEERWQPSHAKKDLSKSDKKDEEFTYVGEWAVEEPRVYKGMEGDKGLVVKNPAAHHAISAKFPKKIENKNKALVVQYEVKLQNGLECGGAYLKLLRDNKALHQEEFSNVSPYVVMFGPDKCGSTNKVHLIINHQNPKTGEYEEKHLNAPPAARISKTTELYTVVIHPNNTVLIKIGGVQVKEANLLEDFTPAFNPPKEIDDSKDSKPDDWVDEARIADPEATKPEDWDEDAPYEIVDEEATMPEDWLEDEPLTIPDPEAQMPEDWDVEEDGDWVAPTIPNPKCDDASGCGKWEKPMIKNPAYKGKWSAPMIDNPAYKGIWAPRKIKNPDYFEDKHPANLEPMGAIGFEIWTMQSDIMFDNIYIGHSVEDADAFADETFGTKHPIEELVELAEKPKREDPKHSGGVPFSEDPIAYIKGKLALFYMLVRADPVAAIKAMPETAGGLAAALISILAIVGVIVSMGSAPVVMDNKQVKKATEKVKEVAATAQDKALEAKDRVAEVAASGVDTAKAEVNKRTTRSST